MLFYGCPTKYCSIVCNVHFNVYIALILKYVWGQNDPSPSGILLASVL